jgi:2-dehydropantoate 2-reductase
VHKCSFSHRSRKGISYPLKTDNARLLVIGAGVNGSVCAVGLYNAGFNVTILARGKHYKEVRDEGIIIEDQSKHTKNVTKVPVIESLDPKDCYDYILVVIRKNQVPNLLPALARNKSPNVVFMGNNLAGPNEWIQSLGKERVMLGFVFAAGRREENIIRAIMPKSRLLSAPFGEVDGTITPRLKRLVNIYHQAGFYAEPSTQITDYLINHAAFVVPFGKLVMKYNLDTHALAQSTDVGLMVDAMREILDVLKALNYHIVPKANYVIKFIPRFILITILRILLPTHFMEVGGVWHVSQAPDEINELAKELEILVKKSNLPVPELRKLLKMDALS